MFGFAYWQRKGEVRRLLGREMNREFSRKVRYGKRTQARGSFSQPVWIVPCDDDQEPQFGGAFPAMTKDICPDGVSLLATAALELNRALVVFSGESPSCVLCAWEHSTPVGLGYYQIGLQALEVARLTPEQTHQLQQLPAGGHISGSMPVAAALGV